MADFKQQANRMLAESMAQADIEDMAAWTEPQIAIAVRAVEAALQSTQPPAVGVDVSKEMIERACESLFPRMTMDADHAGLTVQQRQGMFYVCVRDALTAALRTGGAK